jgi:FKBP-type peptidyl-prolyl cis-trans isomerase FklB
MKCCVTRIIGLIILGLTTSLVADDQLLVQTDKEKFSYAIGHQIGGQLAKQILSNAIDIDYDVFVQAIADAILARPQAISLEQMEKALKQHQLREETQQDVAAEAGTLRGQLFQEEYSQRQGVVFTESGLQYRVIVAGTGSSPGPEDSVVVHYVGRLIDGTEFDSSRKRGTPATFSLRGIIPGWQEVIQLMGEGDIWEVVIPSNLAYGPQGSGASIGPNETLVFEIELISVK